MRSCRRENSSEPRSACEERTATAGAYPARRPRVLHPRVLFNSFPFLFLFLPLACAVLPRPAAPGAAPRRRRGVLLLLRVRRLVVPGADGRVDRDLVHGGRLLDARAPPDRRSSCSPPGIVGVLALLGYFKYTAFVGGYALDFVHVITQRTSRACTRFVNSIVLPIGISFYTFEGISYMVDVYRGDARGRARPAALRVLHLVLPAPDRRADRPLRDPAAAAAREAPLRPRPRALGAAALHARPREEGAARRRARALRRPLSRSRRRRSGCSSAWSCALGFGFQIYFDFSAYSDMALGLARIFGIELPWNFDRPYRSASPTEFWRRWHVTLSTWLRDYLYIPLGGNRQGRGAARPEPARDHGPRRPLARRLAQLRRLGPLPRRAARRDAPRAAPRLVAAAPVAVAVTFLLVVDRLGALPHALGAAIGARLRRDARPARARRVVPGHLLALRRSSRSRSSSACRRSGAGRSHAWNAAASPPRRSSSSLPRSSVYTSHPFIYFRF